MRYSARIMLISVLLFCMSFVTGGCLQNRGPGVSGTKGDIEIDKLFGVWLNPDAFIDALNEFGKQGNNRVPKDTRFVFLILQDDYLSGTTIICTSDNHQDPPCNALPTDDFFGEANGTPSRRTVQVRAEQWEDEYGSTGWEFHTMSAKYYSKSNQGGSWYGSIWGMSFDEADPLYGCPRCSCGVIFLGTIANLLGGGCQLPRVLDWVFAHEMGHQMHLRHPDEDGHPARYCCMNPPYSYDCTYLQERFANIFYCDSCKADIHPSGKEHPAQPTATQLGKHAWRVTDDTIWKDSRLSLSISSRQRDYAIGEPIKFSVELKNISNEPVEVYENFEPSDQVVRLHIVNPDGSLTEYEYPAHVEIFLGDGYQGIYLQPGEGMREFYYPLYNRNSPGYTFPVPGAYKVTALYRVDRRLPARIDHGFLVSNEVDVSIRDLSPTERQAEESFREATRAKLASDELMFFYSHAVPKKDKEETLLKEITRRYPDTFFAAYAQYFLAAVYFGRDPSLCLEYIGKLNPQLLDSRREELATMEAISLKAVGDLAGANKKASEIAKDQSLARHPFGQMLEHEELIQRPARQEQPE